MADQIEPRTSSDIASELETETGKLKACIGLVNQTLQFSHKDAEQVARAQSQLFLLTDFLEAIHERLAAITGQTYALAFKESAPICVVKQRDSLAA